MKKSFKISVLTLVITFLCANSFVPSVFAEEPFYTRIKDKVVEWIKPVKLDDQTRSWLLQPGVKAVIYTEMDASKFLTIESDGEILRFHSCGCGMVPPTTDTSKGCPLLLPDYYTYTPEELLIHTTSFKGSIRVGAEILAGAVFLAAGSFPGVGGQAASILGGLAFIGTAINPQQKFEQAVEEDKMASGIVKTVEKELHSGRDPVAVMETGGTFASIAESFQSFLITVKNHGTKQEKKALADEKKKYHAIYNREDSALSCEDAMIADLKAQSDILEAQNEKTEEQNATIIEQNEEIKAQNAQILENQKKELELQQPKQPGSNPSSDPFYYLRPQN